MLPFNDYHFGSQFCKRDAQGAWFFLLGYIAEHQRTCVVERCILCDAIRETILHIDRERDAAQRRRKIEKQLQQGDP